MHRFNSNETRRQGTVLCLLFQNNPRQETQKRFLPFLSFSLPLPECSEKGNAGPSSVSSGTFCKDMVWYNQSLTENILLTKYRRSGFEKIIKRFFETCCQHLNSLSLNLYAS